MCTQGIKQNCYFSSLRARSWISQTEIKKVDITPIDPHPSSLTAIVNVSEKFEYENH